MTTLQLTLLVKPGCHLCDDARNVIARVLSSAQVIRLHERVDFEELNILEHDELRARYAEEIPVLFVNGKQHSYWHVDADRLIEALVKGD